MNSVKSVLEISSVIIGESRRSTEILLKRYSINTMEKKIYCLDNLDAKEISSLKNDLDHLPPGTHASLFSDAGMPVLFDPGKEIIDYSKTKFTIKTLPGPTSWGTACAVSAFEPPFLLIGFPPQKRETRESSLLKLRGSPYHLVLMDTPYRFEKLVNECREIFGGQQEGFIAYEISKEKETYLWGNLDYLLRGSSTLHKGEFILILKGRGLPFERS